MKVQTKFQNSVGDEDRVIITNAIDKLIEQGIKYNKTDLGRVTWVSQAISGRNFEGLKSFTVQS